MAGTFKFELVTPERVMLSLDVDQVEAPGSEGDFTVFEGHAPVITTLRPGVLQVKAPDKSTSIFVRSGFAEVTADSLTVLAERAFLMDEFDADQVSSELSAAQAELEQGGNDEETRLLTIAVDQLKSLQA